MNCATSTPETADKSIVNISCYKFAHLHELPTMREDLRSRCETLNIKGTILLSPEGINLFLAADRGSIDDLVDHLRTYDGLQDLKPKESFSTDQPFSRMLVRLKKEIIAFGVAGIDPANHTSRKISATQLKQWLDDGENVTLLDTRNDYEIEIGTFRGAKAIGVDHFRDFPAAVDRLPDSEKQKRIVMFCTGGIRCEKAGPYMEQQGFHDVYQLDGGILKYFQEVGGDHWDGECFVFDKRVAVDPKLDETATTQCYACLHPLTPTDQQSPDYVPNQSCAYCISVADQRRSKSIDLKQKRLNRFADNLPGSKPYNNYRPLNVQQKYAGLSLIDFVDQMHPHMGRSFWEETIGAGRLSLGGNPAAADLIVREGMSLRHLLPNTVEPAVNCAIKILHEDDDLVVVSKPAPLPAHPSGRFNRNTLIWMLQDTYAPQRLKAVHRLDSNTSGIVVVARHRKAAAAIQPLFENGQVTKTYLAKVHGHPEQDTFKSDAPISNEVGDHGLRTVDTELGLPSETHFQVLQRFQDGSSLLEVNPITGRTNQIRIHLWHLGHPIQGDLGYLPQHQLGHSGTLEVDQVPMCLHAWKIQFAHPQSGETVQFEAEPPKWSHH